MNFSGISIVLNDSSGNLVNGGLPIAIGVALRSALNGSLTITGVANSDGSPASFVLPPGSTGFHAAPGSAATGGGFAAYALSDPTDSGKATIFWHY